MFWMVFIHVWTVYRSRRDPNRNSNRNLLKMSCLIKSNVLKKQTKKSVKATEVCRTALLKKQFQGNAGNTI